MIGLSSCHSNGRSAIVPCAIVETSGGQVHYQRRRLGGSLRPSWGETGGVCIGKPTGKRHGESLACSVIFVALSCSPSPLPIGTTPSVAVLSLGRIPGRLQCPREWSQVVSLRPVPRLAPTVRENRHRHIFPRSPGLNLFHLCAAAAFVLPQRHSSLACPAVPRPRHSTRPNSGNRGILTKENKPKLSRIFYQPSTLNPLQLSTSFVRSQLQLHLHRDRQLLQAPTKALCNFSKACSPPLRI